MTAPITVAEIHRIPLRRRMRRFVHHFCRWLLGRRP